MGEKFFRYEEVESHISAMIESAALSPGERLPSLRSLSKRLNVSISTVSQAYVELEKKGLIEARSRSGFYVRSAIRQLPLATKTKGPAMEPKMGNRSQLIQTVLGAVGNKKLLPLGVICPAEELLPGKTLSRIMASVVRENAGGSLAYETIQGNLELRRQIAFRSMDAGFSVSPEDIIVTSGAMEALYIAIRSITRPGDNVLIQSPTYYCFLQLLENCGLRAIEIPSCPENGIAPADVEKALQKFDIRACIFSSNFNNPDGSLSPESRKKEIVDLLSKSAIPLVEDDVSGELYFGSSRPGTYKEHDRNGLVLHCSSFSKTISPGYRVGWIIPGIYHQKAMDIKSTTNVCSATPTQMAIAAYLRNGNFDRHLKRLRNAIEKQMQIMHTHLSQYFPEGTRATRPKGGGVLWLEMPESIDSVDYFFRAKEKGIGIVPGTIFSTQDKYNNFIRISCNGIWTEEIRWGIETLGKLAKEMKR